MGYFKRQDSNFKIIMSSDNELPFFRRKLKIQGNCLFLMGPIGTFFARLSNFLEKNNVRT